jgi:hypothetical protein
MQNEIIDKLSRELREPIESERQVVYLLVELRKLLELRDELNNWTSIKFHCDWAVHAKLDGPLAQSLVRLFDRHLELLEVGRPPHASAEYEFRLVDDLNRMISLDRFREELTKLIERLHLDSSIVRDDERWQGFAEAYCGVISDCPLRCTGKGLRHAEEVVLTIAKIEVNGHARARVQWNCRSIQTNRDYCETVSF